MIYNKYARWSWMWASPTKIDHSSLASDGHRWGRRHHSKTTNRSGCRGPASPLDFPSKPASTNLIAKLMESLLSDQSKNIYTLCSKQKTLILWWTFLALLFYASKLVNYIELFDCVLLLSNSLLIRILFFQKMMFMFLCRKKKRTRRKGTPCAFKTP